MQMGFIKLHRGILEWEWYDDPNTMRLFIHCLLRANHKDNNWRGIFIKRGSFLTSLETLSKETKLSISQIRTAFKKLKSTNEIASLSQARNRMVTIVNYESYQANDKVDDKVVTSSSQDSDKLVATNKNEKNEKNEKNIKVPYQLIVDAYNELSGLPKVVSYTAKRKSAVKKLFNFNEAHQDLDWWKYYFTKVSGISFLHGENDRGWTANFDFVLDLNKFVKILEGDYK